MFCVLSGCTVCRIVPCSILTRLSLYRTEGPVERASEFGANMSPLTSFSVLPVQVWEDDFFLSHQVCLRAISISVSQTASYQSLLCVFMSLSAVIIFPQEQRSLVSARPSHQSSLHYTQIEVSLSADPAVHPQATSPFSHVESQRALVMPVTTSSPLLNVDTSLNFNFKSTR